MIGSASASPNEATFDFNYGFDPAVITVEMVNYTDSEGTALRVSIHRVESTKSNWKRLSVACMAARWKQQVAMLPLQGYFAYNNSTMTERPAVVVIPDYDGIGPYEFWRANLLAQLGYAGTQATLYCMPCNNFWAVCLRAVLALLYLIIPKYDARRFCVLQHLWLTSTE